MPFRGAESDLLQMGERQVLSPSDSRSISASATAAEVAKQSGCGKMVSAGISCQPFSLDDRSRSFTGTLQLSYLLQSVMTILECTPEAKRSQLDSKPFRIAQ